MSWTSTEIPTERLRLRAFRSDDAEAIRELLTDPRVRRYLGGPVDPTVIVDRVSRLVGGRPGVFAAERTDNGEVIGSFSIDRQHGEPEVSYDLLPSSWGATSLGMTDPPRSVIAVTQTANHSSRRLLRRLGFVPEREFEEFGAMQSQYRRELDRRSGADQDRQ